MFTEYLLVINIIAFCLYGLDKHYARRRQYRIPEKTLFMVAMAGGTAGALAGIYLWHHKTKHVKFTMGIPAIMLVQTLLVFYYYGS